MNRLFACSALVVSALFCEPGVIGQQTPHHEFSVSARRHAFDPARLEVHLGDLVKVTLRSEDIPHSFVVDVSDLQEGGRGRDGDVRISR
jgi:plastocyanin